MDRSDRPRDAGWWEPVTEEYEFTVTVRAVETFKNVMAKQGVDIPVVEKVARFHSTRLLDMKALKERGVIGSYTIVRAMTTRRLVEEG